MRSRESENFCRSEATPRWGVASGAARGNPRQPLNGRQNSLKEIGNKKVCYALGYVLKYILLEKGVK